MSDERPPTRREAPITALLQWEDDARVAIALLARGADTILQRPPQGLSEAQQGSVSAIVEQAQRLRRLLEGFAPPAAPPRAVGAGVAKTRRAEAPSAPAILIAEDDEEIRAGLADLLSSRYVLTFARDGGEVMTALRQCRFDLVILDVGLPIINGLALVETMRAQGDEGLPAFMFLSAQADARLKVRALALGAVDYVTKPFDPDELMARIARSLRAVTREASLRADAMTDPLTGLANGRSFADGLDRELARSRRHGLPLSLLTVDVDHLKAINDQYGHDVGNEAIRLVARVLAGTVRSFEVVARLGGDEFAVILPNTGAVDAHRLGERLRMEISELTLRGAKLSASIGVASCDDKSNISAVALVKASDEALYRAKRGGRDRVETSSLSGSPLA